MTIYTGLTIGGLAVLVIVWLFVTIYQNVWGGLKRDLDTKHRPTPTERFEKLKRRQKNG